MLICWPTTTISWLWKLRRIQSPRDGTRSRSHTKAGHEKSAATRHSRRARVWQSAYLLKRRRKIIHSTKASSHSQDLKTQWLGTLIGRFAYCKFIEADIKEAATSACAMPLTFWEIFPTSSMLEYGQKLPDKLFGVQWLGLQEGEIRQASWRGTSSSSLRSRSPLTVTMMIQAHRRWHQRMTGKTWRMTWAAPAAGNMFLKGKLIVSPMDR